MSPSILISSFFYFIKGKVGGAAYFSNRYGGEKFEHFFLDEASIFCKILALSKVCAKSRWEHWSFQSVSSLVWPVLKK